MQLLTLAKRFISKINEPKEDDMVVVDIGHIGLCLPKDKAFQLVELIEQAEVYESKYWSAANRKERGMTAEYTHHVYPNDKPFTMRILGDDFYRMAKLAGKPEQN